MQAVIDPRQQLCETRIGGLCRTGYCKAQIRDLNVKDLTASLAISKQLPKGMMLSKLKDAAWRKEGFLLVNVIRGTVMLSFPTHYLILQYERLLSIAAPSCASSGLHLVLFRSPEIVLCAGQHTRHASDAVLEVLVHHKCHGGI